MGLLDDLKKQAENIRQESSQKMMAYSANLAPIEQKMRAAFNYFNELSKELKVVKPSVNWRFLIFGVGEFTDLKLAECKVDFRRKVVDDREYIDFVKLHFVWQSAQGLVAKRTSRGMVDQFREMLYRNNLRFELEEAKSEMGVVAAGTFKVSNEIRVDVTLTNDFENGRILISTKNLGKFDETQHWVQPEQMDEAFLDDFASLLIDQPSQFFQKVQKL